jgi:putative ABC transport system permease protein
MIVPAMKLAFRNIRASKRVGLLSITTILLGAVSVVATLTINNNVEKYVQSMIQKSGGPTLTMQIYRNSAHSFSDDDIDFINSLATVFQVIPEISSQNGVVRELDKTFRPLFTGVNTEYRKVRPIKVLEGSFVTDLDVAYGENAAVVSPKVIEELKLEKPYIGKTLALHSAGLDQLVKIVGVAKIDIESFRDTGFVWMPESLFREFFGEYRNKSLLVQSSEYESMFKNESFLQNYFKEIFENEMVIMNPVKQLQEAKTQMMSLVYAGMVLGLLALFSGSVGIMNVMMLSVRLRRREIGLYRALGFSGNSIIAQFVFETVILSLVAALIGSLIGSALGVGMSALLVKPYQSFSEGAVFWGVALTVAVGGFFGMWPAISASRVDPVEALRG